MRAIEITSPGGVEKLKLCERPIPLLEKGEFLVKVHAAGLNRPDVLQRQGKYSVPSGITDIPGLEISGIIVDANECESEFKIGDTVCALIQGGGYAEYCKVPYQLCLPIPDGLNSYEAASLPETFFTVYSNLYDRAKLKKNEKLLVHGGSSGIGVTAIQLAKALGNIIYVTASSDEKCEVCEKIGADKAINYKKTDYVEVVNSLTNNKGINVVLDMVAGDYIGRNIKCLDNDGRIVVIGFQGGVKGNINFAEVMQKRLIITGSTLRSRSIDFKMDIASKLQEIVWPFFKSKIIKPVIFKEFTLEEVQKAHLLMESNKHIGKIILKI